MSSSYRGVEDRSTPPFGCLYVGGQLKSAGFNVIIHHINSKEIETTLNIIQSSTKVVFVGFSVLTGTSVSTSSQFSQKLKFLIPNLPIVWGGVHSSLTPETCLEEPYIDFVVRGEGEITIVKLAETLSTGLGTFDTIDGLSWKDKHGVVHHNKDRAMQPDIDVFNADWSLSNPNRYVKTALDGTPYISFITSRGCPFKCGFCYNQSFNKRRWRGHSTERVLSDLKNLRDITGVEKVTFYDDNFLVNEKRAFRILKGMQNLGMTAIWIEVRLDRFTDDLLSQLRKYGVRTIFVGWESGSDNTLKHIEKGFNREMVFDAFKLAAKYDLEIDASAIVGFPFESKLDWQNTISTVIDIDQLHPGKIKFNIGVYVPYPGTPILSEATKKGFCFPENIEGWADFDILKGQLQLPWLTKRDIKTIMLADRYAKMLFLGGGSQIIIKAVRRIFAFLAKHRLRRINFTCPWEAILYDVMIKLYIKSKNKKL